MFAHGIQFSGTRFWIVHRRRAYGPFDYEWSKDFCGIEFMYCGQKFGEYCSRDEIYADLKPFKLPKSVFLAASVSMGTVVDCVLNGVKTSERKRHLTNRLFQSGLAQFANIDGLEEDAA